MVIKICILLLLISVTGAAIGVTTCASLNSANCLASGYCVWVGSCVNAECHKITEPNACRTGGAVLANCVDLVTYVPPLDNTCRDVGQATFVYAFAKYPYDTSQSTTTTSTLSGIPVTTLMTTTKQKQYKYEVLTLNILKSQKSDLARILSAYLHMQLELQDPEIPPFYVEKAIYESLQAIRDDVTMTNTDRTSLLTQVWRLVDEALFKKLRNYQDYYISFYYFVGFGLVDLNRLSISVTMQLQKFDVTWTTYSDNGFMQLTTMSLEQFGYVDAYSDAIHVEAVKASDGTTFSVTYSLKWTWQDPSLSVGATTIYEFNRSATTATAISTVSCVTASKYCIATSLTSAKTYFFASSSHSTTQACSLAKRNSRAKCMLKFCTSFNYSTNTCS